MIELLIITRLVSDYLWEYKEISAASATLFLITNLLYFLHKNNTFKLLSTDLLFLAFLSLLTFTEIANSTTSSPVELVKFIAYFFIYLAGRIGPTNFQKAAHLGSICLTALIAFSVAAFAGIGYQYWGSVATFSGGYFFKTDMAISALILLAIVSSTLTSRLAAVIAAFFATYIVFKTNARIALPLTIAIPAFAILVRAGYIQRLNARALGYFCLIAGIGMSLFLLIDFRALGLLAFDFSDPFSAANTQGRSVIWAALLEAYSQADPLRKLIGLGLGADAVATSMYSASAQLEGVRAHNSYLYLLICTGVFGSVLFASLLISIFRRAPILILHGDRQSMIAVILFATLMLIFLWTSLTTEIIIRAQLMALVFYSSGIVVQRNLTLKKMAILRRAESSTHS